MTIQACDFLLWKGIDGDGVTEVWYAIPSSGEHRWLGAWWPDLTGGGFIKLPHVGHNATPDTRADWLGQTSGANPGGPHFSAVPDLTGRARPALDYTKIKPTGGTVFMNLPIQEVAYLAQRVDGLAPLQIGRDWSEAGLPPDQRQNMDTATESFAAMVPQLLGA